MLTAYTVTSKWRTNWAVSVEFPIWERHQWSLVTFSLWIFNNETATPPVTAGDCWEKMANSKSDDAKLVIIPRRLKSSVGSRLRTLRQSSEVRPFIFDLGKIKSKFTKQPESLESGAAPTVAPEVKSTPQSVTNTSPQLPSTSRETENLNKTKSIHQVEDNKEQIAQQSVKRIVIKPNRVHAPAFLRLRTLRERTTARPFIFELLRLRKRRKPTVTDERIPTMNFQAPSEMLADDVPESSQPQTVDIPVEIEPDIQRRDLDRSTESQFIDEKCQADTLFKIAEDGFDKSFLRKELTKRKLQFKSQTPTKKSGQEDDGKMSKETDENGYKLHLWKGSVIKRRSKDPLDLDVVLYAVTSVVEEFKNNAEDEFEVRLCDEYLNNWRDLLTEELDKLIEIQKLNSNIKKTRRKLMSRNKFRIKLEKENAVRVHF